MYFSTYSFLKNTILLIGLVNNIPFFLANYIQALMG